MKEMYAPLFMCITMSDITVCCSQLLLKEEWKASHYKPPGNLVAGATGIYVLANLTEAPQVKCSRDLNSRTAVLRKERTKS